MTNEANEATPAADTGAQAAAAATAPPTSSVEATPAAPAAEDASSLIPPNGSPLTPVPLADQVPEKFRVMKDGALDMEATMAKLAKSYTALESGKGVSAAPASPGEYSIKAAEGIGMSEEDMASFVSDPMTKGFLEKLHAAGASNEVASLVLNSYLEFAPQLLAADSERTIQEARAEIGKIWPDAETQKTNLQACARAINAFGTPNEELPGSAKRVYEKYGTDPDFIAFAAAVGAEMQEDKPTVPQGLPSGEDVEELMKGPAYWDSNHPDHARVKAKVTDFYQRQHGTARA